MGTDRHVPHGTHSAAGRQDGARIRNTGDLVATTSSSDSGDGAGNSPAPPPAILRLVFQHDGLLARFGRVVPDALAVLENLCVIADRASHRNVRLEMLAVQFTGIADRAATDPPQPAPAEDAAWRLSPAFHGLPLTHLELPSVADLASLRLAAQVQPEDDRSLIFFSAFAMPVAIAARHGLHAVRVAECATETETVGGHAPLVAYRDIPRLVEERLRLPTARPMSAEARTGGLLRLPGADPAAIRALLLDAARQDPCADWTFLGGHLYLYTENPDLEDRLALLPGSLRISYSVHKTHLVFDLGAGLGGVRVLLCEGGTLQDPATKKAAAPSGSTSAIVSWHVLRRSFWPLTKTKPPPLPADSYRPSPAHSSPWHIALQQLDLITDTLTKAPPESSAESLWQNLLEGLPQGISADIRFFKHPVLPAIGWLSPYGHLQEEALIVLVSPIPSILDTTAASPIATAVAIAHALSAAHPACACLQLLLSPSAPALDQILQAFLQPDEIHRIALVVQLNLPLQPPPSATSGPNTSHNSACVHNVFSPQFRWVATPASPPCINIAACLAATASAPFSSPSFPRHIHIAPHTDQLSSIPPPPLLSLLIELFTGT